MARTDALRSLTGGTSSTRPTVSSSVACPAGGWKAADLWRRFTCSEREELGDSLATTFVREVCLLLKRYDSGERTSKAGDHINLKNHYLNQWAMPPEIATVLNATFSIDTERFASPLNVAADTLTTSIRATETRRGRRRRPPRGRRNGGSAAGRARTFSFFDTWRDNTGSSVKRLSGQRSNAVTIHH